MADSNIIGGNSNYSGQGLNSSAGAAASTYNTGALRRKYNFGDRVTELALAQDPFFRFVSMVSKNQQTTQLLSLLRSVVRIQKDMHI